MVRVFSEEIGRIKLNVGKRRLTRGSVVSMVSDDAGALHVLTSGPLELHSFYPVCSTLNYYITSSRVRNSGVFWKVWELMSDMISSVNPCMFNA